MSLENGNGTKALWAALLAAGTVMGNGAVWVVSRLAAIDDDRARLSVAVEGRLARVESKLDRVLEGQAWSRRAQVLRSRGRPPPAR